MSENKNLLRIGAIAKQVGISHNSLQNYVKLRLIEPTEVTETGGRLFAKSTVERVKLIKRLNESGYPLRAIQELFFEGRHYLSQDLLSEKKNLLRIGSAARRAGISRQSLQYYLQVGLLEPTEVTPTGRRMFDENIIERIKLIRKLNKSGYPLRAIRDLFFENLYDQSQAFLRPEKTSQIAIASREAWTKLINELSRSPELLHGLDPRKFEELIAELLDREGLNVHLTPMTRDGGRDILAYYQTPVGNHLYLVECKRHQLDNPVGIAVVQRLYGVISQERATYGLIVATSLFSKVALSFADKVKYQIGLKDYEAIKRWLRSQMLA